MEKCKFCQAELAENSTVCPSCGKDNAETKKKATPGKIALAVAAVVVLVAALIALVAAGLNSNETAETVEETVAAETVEATIPADGNPNDETAKGTYTASDEEVIAAADTVVARAGDYELTNGQLQVCYWMEVQNFLNSYGSYAFYFGLDYTKPLDTQVCTMAESETWQQFFLAGALNTWQNYQAMAAEAEKAGFQLDADTQAYLDSIEENMEQSAVYSGFENAQEFLAYNVGRGAAMKDYVHFMELYYPGMMYFEAQQEANAPSEEEVEAYFNENEQAYLDSGLSRDDKYVDVRHVLIMPEGADSSTIRSETFSEEAWETSRVKAEELLAQWEKGDKTEDSFAALAMENSQDGSASSGGLYTDVTEGQMVEAFNDWCFDESRKPGDYGIVETEFGYHLMYFVDSRPVWKEYAKSDLSNERANQLLNDAVAGYPLEVEYDKILLGYVDMTGGEAETEETAGTSVMAESVLDADDMPILVIAGVAIAALAAVAFVFHKKDNAL